MTQHTSMLSAPAAIDARRAAHATRDSAPDAALTVDWLPLGAIAQGAWRVLAQRALEPNVFLEPAFALAAVKHLDLPDIGAVVVRSGERLLGLLPGRVEGIRHGRLLPTFVAWTHPFAPLSTPLVDREGAADTVGTLLRHLPALPGSPRLALFPLLPEKGAVASLIAAQAPYRAFARHRRAALVPADDRALAASAKMLKELRRQRRLLADAGTLVHEQAEGPAVAPALTDFFDVEAAGWKGRSGSAAKLDLAVARFVTEAVSVLAGERKARLDLLKLEGVTIAATITLYSGNRGWFWKTGFDEAHGKFSPGAQIALALSEALLADPRLTLIDSCAVADHPMIDRLWGGRIDMADWLLPLASRPSFTAGLVAERTRRTAIAGGKAIRRAWLPVRHARARAGELPSRLWSSAFHR